jgi:hypothetical protein
MENKRLLILSLITILAISNVIKRNDLYGQSSCDTSASPFVLCEDPPLPSISYSQLEEIFNSSIDIKNEHINDGDIIRIIFIINCKGEDFNYRSLQRVDTTLMDNLFKLIHSNMKWTPGRQGGRKIDFQQTIPISIENGKFRILSDNDKKLMKKKK